MRPIHAAQEALESQTSPIRLAMESRDARMQRMGAEIRDSTGTEPHRLEKPKPQLQPDLPQVADGELFATEEVEAWRNTSSPTA
eukprot:COSAG06_NODE_378_length_16640_cov_13.584729_2_plen_84_part_00